MERHREIDELIHLCKVGKLFAVQEWIASGKPVNAPPGYRTSPLRVSIEHGFHSLVELLIKNRATMSTRRGALEVAIRRRKFEICELLIDSGITVTPEHFVSLCERGERKVVGMMLDRGIDLVTGLPFAHAFRAKNFPLVRVYKENASKFPELRPQGEMALRYFCGEEDLKWVSFFFGRASIRAVQRQAGIETRLILKIKSPRSGKQYFAAVTRS